MPISVPDGDASFSLLPDTIRTLSGGRLHPPLHPSPPPIAGIDETLCLWCSCHSVDCLWGGSACRSWGCVSGVIPPLNWTWERQLCSPAIKQWPVCFSARTYSSESPAEFWLQWDQRWILFLMFLESMWQFPYKYCSILAITLGKCSILMCLGSAYYYLGCLMTVVRLGWIIAAWLHA